MTSFLRDGVIRKATNQPNTSDFKKKIELISKIKVPYPMKMYYNSIIPLNIFQTWHTKNVPEKMKKNIELIKTNNPAFNYYLYDDDDCYNFIKEHYNADVLNAFDTLIPGAYKADLWRYCVLYKLGGIYIDIKYKPLNNFKFINLTEKEHWVLDIDKNGIYNAVMVCLPYNTILKRAIEKVVENVKNRYYGGSSLDPTGPGLLSKLFSSQEKKKFDMYHEFYESCENRFVFFNKYMIFKSYNGYIEEHGSNQKKEHYSVLWGRNKIYK
jgi:mannosyltransferase OCH1-like enzyme